MRRQSLGASILLLANNDLDKKGTNAMKLRQLTLALSLVGATSVGLVGCGGSSNDYPEILSIEGTAINHYLQNAIACVDTNGDKSCSGEDNSTRTDLSGAFDIRTTDGNSPIIVEVVGGETAKSETKGVLGSIESTDVTLTAPAGSAVVTPITTLLQAEIERGTANAESALAVRLGLSADTDINTYDPLELGDTTTESIFDALSVAIRRVTAEGVAAAGNKETGYEAGLLLLLEDGATTTSTTLDDLVAAPGSFTQTDDLTVDSAELEAAVQEAAEANAEEGDPEPTGASGGNT